MKWLLCVEKELKFSKRWLHFLFDFKFILAHVQYFIFIWLTGVATAFVGNFWMFSLCRFFVGFAFDNCFTMMYILGKLKSIDIGHDNSIFVSIPHCTGARREIMSVQIEYELSGCHVSIVSEMNELKLQKYSHETHSRFLNFCNQFEMYQA